MVEPSAAPGAPASGPPSLLVVVAHPDDETFGCGSVIAAAAARGARVTVVCATRGEAGEPSAHAGPIGADLGTTREAELREAARLLGASAVEVLEYRDSGFDGPAAPATLCATEPEVLSAAVAEVVARVQPHAVVTLDGSDGHRDHVHLRDATTAAVVHAGRPGTRLYHSCLPNSLMRRWLDEMRRLRPDTAYLGLDPATLGRADADLTTVVDVAAHLELREAAIAVHRSQASPFDGLSPDLRRAFLATDHLVRVLPAWPGGPVETELDLAGGGPTVGPDGGAG
jgi:LmbE family N-acetylglucosaminyl deacetylase